MFTICACMFGLSTLIQVTKNAAADEKIKRSNFDIIDDKRSSVEIFSSFVKEYIYLLVPGLNIIKAGKIFFMKESEYFTIRKNNLSDNERLIVKIDDKKPQPVKNEEKLIEAKDNKPAAVSSRKPTAIENSIDDVINLILNSNDIEEVSKCEKDYRLKFREMRAKYDEILAINPEGNIESDNCKRRLKIYANIIEFARERKIQLSHQPKRVIK